MFSLSALTGAARAAQPVGPPSGAEPRSSDGIDRVDIGAIVQTPEHTPSTPGLAFGVSPFGAPPLGSLEDAREEDKERRSSPPGRPTSPAMWIGGGIAVAGLAMAAAFVLGSSRADSAPVRDEARRTSGEQGSGEQRPAPAAPPVRSDEPRQTRAEAAEPAPVEEPGAEPAKPPGAAATSEPGARKPAKKPRLRTPIRGSGQKLRRRSEPKRAEEPDPKPANEPASVGGKQAAPKKEKPESGCGCRASDLVCAMRCATSR